MKSAWYSFSMQHHIAFLQFKGYIKSNNRYCEFPIRDFGLIIINIFFFNKYRYRNSILENILSTAVLYLVFCWAE